LRPHEHGADERRAPRRLVIADRAANVLETFDDKLVMARARDLTLAKMGPGELERLQVHCRLLAVDQDPAAAEHRHELAVRLAPLRVRHGVFHAGLVPGHRAAELDRKRGVLEQSLRQEIRPLESRALLDR
jgi:hypothetical protein